MDQLCQPPTYRLQVNSRILIIRLYSPLCTIEKTNVTIEERLLKITFDPYIITFTLPAIFLAGKLEKAHDDILQFCELKIVRNDGDGTFVHSGIVLEKLEDSIKAHLTFGGMQFETKIAARRPAPYGFMNQYFNQFGLVRTEYSDLIELTDPDNTSRRMRRSLRRRNEDISFNYFHYAYNLGLIFTTPNVFTYVPPWSTRKPDDNLTPGEESVLFITRTYNIEVKGMNIWYFQAAKYQLLDVMLAYCYSKRVYQDRNIVSEAWTIAKLSSTLSWFDVYHSLTTLVRDFYRRSVTYPIYRNWELTNLVRNDAVQLLRSGTIAVVKAKIDVREIFYEVPNYHIFNKLYVNHLIHFAKYLSNDQYDGLAWALDTARVQKTDVRYDLIVVETVHLRDFFIPMPQTSNIQENTNELSTSNITDINE